VTRILILGGGYIGLYTALTLERKLKKTEAQVTLVSRENYMVYQPFLPEAASGSIEPRHVVVPLRRALKRTKVVTARLTALDHARKAVTVQPWEGPEFDIAYDIVVIGLGAIARVLPIPGLAENAIGFTSVEEAIFLRNQILSRLDAANTLSAEATRRRALTFVFVGGGYAGVEALAELEDLARDALGDYFPSIKPEEMRWVLVEARGEILPEMGSGMGNYALERLRRRGIEIHLNTILESAEHGKIRLANGQEFEADTIVWTAGVRPHPLVTRLGLPTDEMGRVVVDEHLRVRDIEGVWAGGDCAAVPLPDGNIAPPTAQHALREGRLIGANIAATLHGKPLTSFRYRGLGMLVSLGRHKGVARVICVVVHGLPAWFLHRTYHLTRIPTLSRKARVVLDWTVALFFKRDIVQLGSLHHPKESFEQAFKQD
jgi:NADH dehydrogenase